MSEHANYYRVKVSTLEKELAQMTSERNKWEFNANEMDNRNCDLESELQAAREALQKIADNRGDCPDCLLDSRIALKALEPCEGCHLAPILCGGITLKEACETISSQAEEINRCKVEAEGLATHIWKHHFKEDSPNWGLCDTPSGVMTQIDNMYCGLRERLQILQQQLSRYESATSVEGVVKDMTCTEWSYAYIEMPKELIGKRVRVLILPEEEV